MSGWWGVWEMQWHEQKVDRCEINWYMVPGGVEPPTLRLLAVRSNQLSYET